MEGQTAREVPYSMSRNVQAATQSSQEENPAVRKKRINSPEEKGFTLENPVDRCTNEAVNMSVMQRSSRNEAIL
jgi:Tfp pilus assembly protein PilV